MIQLSNFPRIPYMCSFAFNLSCGTVSNALEKSNIFVLIARTPNLRYWSVCGCECVINSVCACACV